MTAVPGVEYDEIVSAAATALARSWGRPVELAPAEVLVDYAGAAAVLLRSRVLAPPSGRSTPVVVKRSNVPGGILPEWSGLALAAELPAVRMLVPRLLAADEAANLLVMTDVAASGARRVGDVLFAPDAGDAEQVLAAAQVALGRFNAAGTRRDSAQAGRRRPAPAPPPSRHAVNRLDEALGDLPRVLASHLDGPVPEAVAAETARARACVSVPGPFTTLTHGDPTVGNLLYAPEAGVRFVDLETAAYRHALVDGSFACLRYLYSVWARTIPLPLRRRLLAAYRTELARDCPEAADEAAFGDALVAACAAWLAALCLHLDRVGERDVRWGRATYRQRIVTGLRGFGVVADEYGRYPALADTAARLEEQLRDRWPGDDCRLAPYPGLSGGCGVDRARSGDE